MFATFLKVMAPKQHNMFESVRCPHWTTELQNGSPAPTLHPIFRSVIDLAPAEHGITWLFFVHFDTPQKVFSSRTWCSSTKTNNSKLNIYIYIIIIYIYYNYIYIIYILRNITNRKLQVWTDWHFNKPQLPTREMPRNFRTSSHRYGCHEKWWISIVSEKRLQVDANTEFGDFTGSCLASRESMSYPSCPSWSS